MNLDIEKTQALLCQTLCVNVRIIQRKKGLLMLETPFTFPDGDHYVIYLESLNSGGVRITDGGHTFMHLSYENDVSDIREGTRGKLFDQVIAESSVSENDGELWIDTSYEELSRNIFRFGQVLTRIYDLTFLNRSRVASTFYEDLHRALEKIVPAERVVPDYLVPELPQKENYPIDFLIEGGPRPLFVFGLPQGRDKARLATIILQHLISKRITYESLLVFEDQSLVPRRDLARLSDVGGEQVSSLVAEDDLSRKILKRVAAA